MLRKSKLSAHKISPSRHRAKALIERSPDEIGTVKGLSHQGANSDLKVMAILTRLPPLSTAIKVPPPFPNYGIAMPSESGPA
jgi:hypothetical protein